MLCLLLFFSRLSRLAMVTSPPKTSVYRLQRQKGTGRHGRPQGNAGTTVPAISGDCAGGKARLGDLERWESGREG